MAFGELKQICNQTEEYYETSDGFFTYYVNSVTGEKSLSLKKATFL